MAQVAANVAALSREKKVEEAMLRGGRLLPGDVRAEFMAMLTPQVLAFSVATLVGLAVAQAFGIGEFIDALVLLAGIGFCGWGAVGGCRDLYHFVRVAVDARSEKDLDLAGQYFAGAVTKIGVNTIMAFLLKKPLKSFHDLGGLKFNRVNPGLLRIEPPPAPNSVPVIEFRVLEDSVGETSPYGNIVVDPRLSVEETNITIDHELVHRFFSPRFGPLQQLRAQIRINGYVRSAMLKYLEEALAEGYAQMRAHGFKRGVMAEIKWPIKGGYLSIQDVRVIRGLFLGTIVVEGKVFHVSLALGRMESSSRSEPKSVRQPQPEHKNLVAF